MWNSWEKETIYADTGSKDEDIGYVSMKCPRTFKRIVYSDISSPDG